MKLLDLVNTYVTFKRSLGMRFATQPRVLRRFARVLGDAEAADVTSEAVQAFLDGDGPLTNTWFLNYRLLRHTAAVHRMIAWSRDGADVQRLLPQLATYLGHKDLRGTQHYLTMTPELLERASLRFQNYADPEVRHA